MMREFIYEVRYVSASINGVIEDKEIFDDYEKAKKAAAYSQLIKYKIDDEGRYIVDEICDYNRSKYGQERFLYVKQYATVMPKCRAIYQRAKCTYRGQQLPSFFEYLGLTERESRVYESTILERRTLDQVGREFNITRERCRQIQAKANRKIKFLIGKLYDCYLQGDYVTFNKIVNACYEREPFNQENDEEDGFFYEEYEEEEVEISDDPYEDFEYEYEEEDEGYSLERKLNEWFVSRFKS